MTTQNTRLSDDDCYLALKAKDARFDGRFFTGVLSTGIYCRPVCNVKTPLRKNCRFFSHAAQAESAGFRPCLRCRPELAPHSVHWSIQDASFILAHQAARLLDEPDSWTDETASVEKLAARLGVSASQLAELLEVDVLQFEPVLETLVELDWIGQLNDAEGSAESRYVLLADPETTQLEPLMQNLLIDSAPSLKNLWEKASWPSLKLRDAL